MLFRTVGSIALFKQMIGRGTRLFPDEDKLSYDIIDYSGATRLFAGPEWIPDGNDDLVRWTLWSKGRAVVSHDSALAVHGIGEFEAARVHLTVPPGFSMRGPAVALHVAELPDGDVEARAGFSLTTVVRSLVDIAVAADEDQPARTIHDAREAGLLTTQQL